MKITWTQVRTVRWMLQDFPIRAAELISNRLGYVDLAFLLKNPRISYCLLLLQFVEIFRNKKEEYW